MFGFAVVATAPVLLLSRLIAPRKLSNPIKFLPMECGQVPSGAGRTHFMMQYYAYILMFVIFDVMAIFLYAWGSTIRDYDVLMPDLLHIKDYNAAKRSVFIIMEDGTIGFKWVSDDPLKEPNYDDIKEFLKK